MYAFAYNLYEPPVDGVNGDAALHANHIADRNCPSRSNDGADCLLHSGNVRIFDQRLKSATRRSATTKDQKWPYFSKVSTTCLTRWNGRRNYEDSHSSFGSARTCPSGVKSSSTWPSLSTWLSPSSTHSTLMDPLLILELISQVCV